MSKWLLNLINEKSWLGNLVGADSVEECEQTLKQIINKAIENLAKANKHTKITEFNRYLAEEIREAIKDEELSDEMISKLLYDIAQVNLKHSSEQNNEYNSLIIITYKILLREIVTKKTKKAQKITCVPLRKEDLLYHYNEIISENEKQLIKYEMRNNKEKYLSALESINSELKHGAQVIHRKLIELSKSQPSSEKNKKVLARKKKILTNLLQSDNKYSFHCLQKLIKEKIQKIHNAEKFTSIDMDKIYRHFDIFKSKVYHNLAKYDEGRSIVKRIKSNLRFGKPSTKRALINTISNLSSLIHQAKNDAQQAAVDARYSLTK